MVELGRVITEQAIGKLGENGKQWKWAICKLGMCRFGKFEVGGETRKRKSRDELRGAPEQSKSSGSSSQISPTQNYSEEERLIWDRRNRQYYDACPDKGRSYVPKC